MTTDSMTPERRNEINQFIALNVMSVKCWHRVTHPRIPGGETFNGFLDMCELCRETVTMRYDGQVQDNLDYFTLDRCFEAQSRTVEKFGLGVYGDQVLRELDKPMLNIYFGGFDENQLGRVATAPVEPRLLAILELWKQEGKDEHD